MAVFEEDISRAKHLFGVLESMGFRRVHCQIRGDMLVYDPAPGVLKKDIPKLVRCVSALARLERKGVLLLDIDRLSGKSGCWYFSRKAR